MIAIRPMQLIDLVALSDDERASLQHQVDGLGTLAHVLDWARSLHPPVPAPEVITQDEYTHDVLVPLDADRYLAFDTT
jgi:hypothetical protein